MKLGFADTLCAGLLNYRTLISFAHPPESDAVTPLSARIDRYHLGPSISWEPIVGIISS